MKFHFPQVYCYYFPTFCFIAICIYSLQRMNIFLPEIIQNYMNDFLCIPIILYICQTAVRKLRSDSNILLSLSLMLIVTLGYAIYFEWYLPRNTYRYTADWMDVALYLIGMYFFYKIERIKLLDQKN